MEGLKLPAPPAYWTIHAGPIPGLSIWDHKIDGLKVVRTLSTTKAGEKWIHISVSRQSRMPSWDDISRVKRDFLGDDKEAYQVLPRKEDHVNIHSFCLHFWCPVNGARVVANLMELIHEVSI